MPARGVTLVATYAGVSSHGSGAPPHVHVLVLHLADHGRYCLPQDIMEADRGDAKAQVWRAAWEQAHLDIDLRATHLVEVRSKPRLGDPRGHVVNIVYWTALSFAQTQKVRPGVGVAEAAFRPLRYIRKNMSLAWDHQDVIMDGRWEPRGT